jgi:hypothetical protein
VYNEIEAPSSGSPALTCRDWLVPEFAAVRERKSPTIFQQPGSQLIADQCYLVRVRLRRLPASPRPPPEACATETLTKVSRSLCLARRRNSEIDAARPSIGCSFSCARARELSITSLVYYRLTANIASPTPDQQLYRHRISLV